MFRVALYGWKLITYVFFIVIANLEIQNLGFDLIQCFIALHYAVSRQVIKIDFLGRIFSENSVTLAESDTEDKIRIDLLWKRIVVTKIKIYSIIDNKNKPDCK